MRIALHSLQLTWIIVLGLAIGPCLGPGSQASATGAQTPCTPDHAEPTPIVAFFLANWSVEDLAEGILPRLVVYDDGLVLFMDKEAGGRVHMMESHLSKQELGAFVAALEPFNTFFELKSHYNLNPCLEHGPVARLFLSRGGRIHGVTVHGFPWGENQPNATSNPCNSNPEAPPSEFKRFADILLGYRPTHANLWRPLWLSVHLKPWNYVGASPGEPIDWPVDWPGPEQAFKLFPSQEILELRLASEHEPLLASITREVHMKQRPLRIVGRLWDIWYRPAVPGARKWEPLLYDQ